MTCGAKCQNVLMPRLSVMREYNFSICSLPVAYQRKARIGPLFAFGVRFTEPLFANRAANSRRKPADHIFRGNHLARTFLLFTFG